MWNGYFNSDVNALSGTLPYEMGLENTKGK